MLISICLRIFNVSCDFFRFFASLRMTSCYDRNGSEGVEAGFACFYSLAPIFVITTCHSERSEESKKIT